MHFIEISSTLASQKYFDTTQQTSNFQLNYLLDSEIGLFIALDHNPRDSIVHIICLLMNNHQSNVGQDESHLFWIFMFVKYTLFVYCFDLLLLKVFVFSIC